MDNLYEKLMAFTDEEFLRLENEEKELLSKLGAKKLHEFDNVGVGKNGEMYALSKLLPGEEIIKNGNVFAKIKSKTERGEPIVLK